MIIDKIQNWSDEKGNSITFAGDNKMRRSQIEFLDKNSKIHIGKGCELRDAKIRVGSNSVLEIGNGSSLDGNIQVGAYSSILIGENTYITHNINLKAAEKTVISIGEDCLFGSNISIFTFDGHPIYCTKTGKRLNTSGSIEIGDHVWIRDNVKIQKNVQIGEASIIEAASVVTHNVERTSLFAGVPAQKIESDVTWEHSTGDRTDRFYSFATVRGIKIAITPELMTPAIKKAIDGGTYEGLEARQLPRLLKEGDRVLEFGAGLGFISAYCSSLVDLEKCVVVEANPALIPIINSTHELNKTKADVKNAVALSKDAELWSSVDSTGKIPFYVSSNFWGSSLSSNPHAAEVVNVPVLKVEKLISEVRPTIIICDIEGGEIDLLDHADLSSVRHILFEVHKGILGLSGINRVSRNLSAKGLYYDPDFSVGQVVVFSKE